VIIFDSIMNLVEGKNPSEILKKFHELRVYAKKNKIMLLFMVDLKSNKLDDDRFELIKEKDLFDECVYTEIFIDNISENRVAFKVLKPYEYQLSSEIHFIDLRNLKININ
jgi:hypothetical protein